MNSRFEFDGIEVHGPYLSACIKVTLGNDIDSIGYTVIKMNLPFCKTDQPLHQTIEALLRVAREAIQTRPLQDWMDRQRKYQDSPKAAD